MSTVYLLGNGFDINLGLKSHYQDFADSSFWPFGQDTNRRMGVFLNEKKSEVDTWFDLEALLGQYAVMASSRPMSSEVIDEDKCSFKLLVDSLNDYIKLQQNTVQPENDSIAACLVRHFASDTTEPKIFTFNYTDLNFMCRNITKRNRFECHHVHGTCNDNTIIMGFGDELQGVIPTYNFMRKSFNQHYNPPRIIEEILKAHTVVMFGLSMGNVDYSYFDFFFKRISIPEQFVSSSMKRVIIFAYKDSSRMAILNNLYEKTEGHLGNLNALNDFRMVTIGVEPEKDVIDVINSI